MNDPVPQILIIIAAPAEAPAKRKRGNVAGTKRGPYTARKRSAVKRSTKAKK